jgi:hypothetical protein
MENFVDSKTTVCIENRGRFQCESRKCIVLSLPFNDESCNHIVASPIAQLFFQRPLHPVSLQLSVFRVVEENNYENKLQEQMCRKSWRKLNGVDFSAKVENVLYCHYHLMTKAAITLLLAQ